MMAEKLTAGIRNAAAQVEARLAYHTAAKIFLEPH
jgi:hypothetical protein